MKEPKKKGKRSSSGSPGLPLDSEIVSIAQEIGLSMPERFLLFRLRSPMREGNLSCWKSQETLSLEMGCRRETVFRLVKKLEEKGLITVTKRKTRRGEVNEHAINFPWKGSSASRGLVTQDHKGGCDLRSQGVVTDDHKGVVIHDHLNKQGSSSKNNKQKNHHRDDDRFFSSSQEKEAGKTGKKKQEEQPREGALTFFVPPVASEEQLKIFYRGHVPPAVDLTRSSYDGIDLAKYVRPFRGKASALIEKFGQDFDDLLEGWWEEQAEQFCEEAISANWDHNSGEEPSAGFEKVLLRACRAGVINRYGFCPKSPAELEAEEKERERLEAEREKKEAEKRAKEEREEAERRKQEEKNRRLLAFLQSKRSVHDYFAETRLIEGEKINLRKIRDRIREITEGTNGNAIAVLIEFCEAEVSRIQKAKKQKEELRFLEKTLLSDDTLRMILCKRGFLPPKMRDETSMLSPDKNILEACLTKLDKVRVGLMSDDLEVCFSYLKEP